MSEDNRSSGSDPIGDFQRWLMRSSAKRMGRELKGQAQRAFGGPPQKVDVWEAATAEPLPDEAPECAWCPVCRAARRFRQSGPGLASHVAGAGDALLTVAQDTLAAFEATLSGKPPGSAQRPADRPADRPAARPPWHKGAAAPSGTGWPSDPSAARPSPSARGDTHGSPWSAAVRTDPPGETRETSVIPSTDVPGHAPGRAQASADGPPDAFWAPGPAAAGPPGAPGPADPDDDTDSATPGEAAEEWGA